MSKKTFKAVVGALFVLAILAVLASVKIDVRLSPRDLAFGQAASYQVMAVSPGAGVNGRPSIFVTTQQIDSVSGVAAGTLNGTFSPVYDVSQINERARMIGISFNVTAVPGTSPSLTPKVQQSDDGGKTWYQVFAQDGSTFSAITATGAVANKDFPVYGDILRISYTSSGTGNFTFTDSAQQAQ